MGIIKYKFSDYIFIDYWQKYLKLVMKRKIKQLYIHDSVNLLGLGEIKVPNLKDLDKELDKWTVEVRLSKKL